MRSMKPDKGIRVRKIRIPTEHGGIPALLLSPLAAPERFDARSGLVYRASPNVARVDAVLATTVPAGQGHRLIERIAVIRTGADAPRGAAAPRTARP